MDERLEAGPASNDGGTENTVGGEFTTGAELGGFRISTTASRSGAFELPVNEGDRECDGVASDESTRAAGNG